MMYRLLSLQIDVVFAHEVDVRRIPTFRCLGCEAVQRLQQLGAEIARHALRMRPVEAPAEVAPDDDAAGSAGEGTDARGERVERSFAHQVELDVRHVQGRDFLAALGHDLADLSQGVWPGKVTDYRDDEVPCLEPLQVLKVDRKSTRLNSSHLVSSYAVF